MKILIADSFPEAQLEQFTQLGCEVTYDSTVKSEDLPRKIGPYKILIVRGKQVTAATLAAAENLTLVLRAGAGVNTIDVKAASAKGIFVSNCPGKNSIAVAELVFGLLLALDRRIPDNVLALRKQQWNKKEFSRANGIFGKTLGVIGVGRIGREVIIRARAFGLHPLAWSRSLTPQFAEELGAEFCPEVDEVLRRSDIVSLHLALKPETRTLIDARRLGLMKPAAMLINTARAELVDPLALQAAVTAGRIRVAADVFHHEPDAGTCEFVDPLLALPNFYGTHHIGASTEQAQQAIALETIRIVRTFLKTGVVLNCVNVASRTPARWQLVIRHYDRVGVLAFVMDQIRRANINIEEVHNTIFEGALTASCCLQLDSEPKESLLGAIKEGCSDVLGVEMQKLD